MQKIYKVVANEMTVGIHDCSVCCRALRFAKCTEVMLKAGYAGNDFVLLQTVNIRLIHGKQAYRCLFLIFTYIYIYIHV